MSSIVEASCGAGVPSRFHSNQDTPSLLTLATGETYLPKKGCSSIAGGAGHHGKHRYFYLIAEGRPSRGAKFKVTQS
jgi:hypothetical protein